MTSEASWQTDLFERNRRHLRAVAFRMLGSFAEADDAVQEAWLRFNRADPTAVDNIDGWLTVIVSRICLDMLRSRSARREELVDEWTDMPIVTLDGSEDPERQALVADTVGIALLVVLETLSPDERLALVLHDMFDVPFDEIAPIVARSVPATRQLASRARRRVQGRADTQDQVTLGDQREIIEAFLAAARAGDFTAIVELLHPDVEFGVDRGKLAPPIHTRGAEQVAKMVLAQAPLRAPYGRVALVNGGLGVAVIRPEGLVAVMSCEFSAGRISSMQIEADPEIVARMRY
jgi:RNA polymerase sigma factor (sigma-70 family)